MKPAAPLAPILPLLLSLAPFTAQCFYNPSTGRWLNRDPLPQNAPGGADPNVYAFTKNSPVSMVDPQGLLTIERVNGTVTHCGSVKLVYNLALSSAPQCEGFIVQELTITEQAVTCKGALVNRPFHLWENVQHVYPKDPTTWSVGDLNQFLDPTLKQGHGYRILSRTVSFYCLKTTGDLDHLWSTIPGADTGPATKQYPTWWAQPSEDQPTAKNTWSVTWNCCCSGSAPNFRDTASGQPVQISDP